MRALVTVVALAAALPLLGAPASALPDLPCPEPVDVMLGDGNTGTHPYVSFGCGGQPLKVCAPTWFGGVDLLMVC